MKKLEKILLGLVILGLVFVVMSCGKASVKMVKIPDRNFEMLQTEVTQDLYESVMGENPSEFKGGKKPVEMVSWYDAIYFCNELSEIKGYEPVYSVDGNTDTTKWNYTPHQGSRLKGIVTQDKSRNGYRLPTEEEWKYAVKGGEDYIYAGSNDVKQVAWYSENSNYKTHPVAQKKANGYGIYDMIGNVTEMCWDTKGGSIGRAHCGGCYLSTDSVWTDDDSPSIGVYYQNNAIGLRVVRTVTE